VLGNPVGAHKGLGMCVFGRFHKSEGLRKKKRTPGADGRFPGVLLHHGLHEKNWQCRMLNFTRLTRAFGWRLCRQDESCR
jgi:hypothetical protein